MALSIDALEKRTAYTHEELTKSDVAAIISYKTGIPVGKVQTGEKERLMNMEHVLKKRVVGQDGAIKSICEAILECRSGLSKAGQSIGSFFFGLQNIMAASAIFFLLPLLVYQTFKKATEIPPKVLKQWFYPVHEEIEEPQESKLKNLLVISFEFKKQTDAEHYTNFRAKAPKDMEVGELFYYFINDYNERHINSKFNSSMKKANRTDGYFIKSHDGIPFLPST